MVEPEALQLPAPPFDFDREELLGVSVELVADRLKGTVAWLVDCIQEQQQLLWSHEVKLGTLVNTLGVGESRPRSRETMKEESEKSRPSSRVTIVEDGKESLRTPPSETDGSIESPKTPGRSRGRKSVALSLQDCMKDDLLAMKVTKLQLELNTKPNNTDLATQREEMRAEMHSLEDKLIEEAKKAAHDTHSELASLTQELYARLERICDDVMKRIEDVESLSKRTNETANDLLADVNRIQLREQQGLKSGYDSSKRIVASSSPNAVAQRQDDLEQVAPRAIEAETDRRQNESNQGAGDPPVMLTPERRPSTSQSAMEGFRRGRGDSSVDGSSTTHEPGQSSMHQSSHQSNTVNAVISDHRIFDSAYQFTDMRDAIDRNYQIAKKVESQILDLKGAHNILNDHQKDDEETIKALEAEIDMLKEYVSSLDSSGDGINAARKEWLEQAACRATTPESSSEQRKSIAARMQRHSTPSDPAVLGRIRPTSGEPSGAALEKLTAELNAEMDDIRGTLTSVQPQIAELRQAIAQIKSLQDTVSEHNEILLPADQPDLGTTVATLARRADDLETWRTVTDKRIRRMNPLDSEFSDVQNELERLRKLFEFVQQVLPPDAAEAMKFFKKSFSRQNTKEDDRHGNKTNAKDLGSKKGKQQAQQAPLIDSVANCLGPEVAFEMQRAKLEDEVRHHEKAMRQEFANLTTAIKSLQREMQQNSGKTVDLVAKFARLEGGGVAPASGTQESSQVEDPSPQSSSRGAMLESRGSQKSAPQEAGTAQEDSDPYVSKGDMQQALKETREDFRNWLDEWSGSFVSALQKKADSNHVVSLLSELQQAMGSAGLTSDTMALIAKRALLGRCASCDANLDVHPDNLKRNPPVPKPSAYPNRPPAGAPVTMRPPAGVSNMPQVLLPKILDPRLTKDFPKSKVFKNPSAPDIRQTRVQDQSEETIQ
jgi:prefoldin subunit 5